MATDGASTFPEVDAEKELKPEKNKDFEVDAVSSDISTSKDVKERYEASGKRNEKRKKDCMQTLKTAILVSAVIAAVAGAAFAITKKLKEK